MIKPSLLCCTLFLTLASAQDITLPPTLTSLGQTATVDWTHNQLVVEGAGTADKGLTQAQAKLLARTAARTDAQRLLLASLAGVQVTSETTIEKLMVTQDLVKTRLQGTLKNAVVLESREEVMADGSVIAYVKMAVPIYGPQGLGAALKDTPVEPATKPAETKPAETPVAFPPPIPANAPYTGLIVDARGLGYLPCMAPKILSSKGEVWGTVKVTSAFANDIGIAGFYHTMPEAQKDRDRGAPAQLVVKALKAAGTARCNVTVSDEDAQKIQSTNEASHYLEAFHVIFVF